MAKKPHYFAIKGRRHLYFDQAWSRYKTALCGDSTDISGLVSFDAEALRFKPCPVCALRLDTLIYTLGLRAQSAQIRYEDMIDVGVDFREGIIRTR